MIELIHSKTYHVNLEHMFSILLGKKNTLGLLSGSQPHGLSLFLESSSGVVVLSYAKLQKLEEWDCQ